MSLPVLQDWNETRRTLHEVARKGEDIARHQRHDPLLLEDGPVHCQQQVKQISE